MPRVTLRIGWSSRDGTRSNRRLLKSRSSSRPLPPPLSYGIIINCLIPAGGVRGADPTSFRKDQEKRKNRKETSSVLMIRLSRVGARKQPHYRVVVIEKARARNGRPGETVGA